MATDTQFFDELRRAGDDRRSGPCPSAVHAPRRRRAPEVPDPLYRPNIFVIVTDSLRPDYPSGTTLTSRSPFVHRSILPTTAS